VTTARHPQHAFRKDSISRKSPVTTSAPAPCNTDAFGVGRTKARTAIPSRRSDHTMALPSLPLEPTTKITPSPFQGATRLVQNLEDT